MSPSWNRDIAVRLFADGAMLEWRRRWPRRVVARAELRFVLPDLAQAAAAVAAELEARAWTGPLHVVLGNRWLRFGRLPWALQSGDDAADAAVAAGWLAQADGNAADAVEAPGAAARVAWARARFGEDRLFALASADTWRALQALAAPQRPLRRWRPWLAPAWNACRAQLREASGVLGLPEAGSLGLVVYEQGRVVALQQRACPSADRDGLVSLLRLEEMRRGHALPVMADALPPDWQAALAAVNPLVRAQPLPALPEAVS